MSNNSTLFKRMTWQAFKNNTEWNDQQIIYIADKNLRVHTKKYDRSSPNSKFFNIIYNGQYGFVENVTIGNLQENQQELIAGIYVIIVNTNQTKSIDLWFYDGRGSDAGQHWFQLCGGSGGGGSIGTVTTVNRKGPDLNGNITITAEDINAIFTDGNTITIQQWLDNLSNQIVSSIITDNHQWYDEKVYSGQTSSTYTDFVKGHIQISGYFEGKIDCGVWE